MKLRRIMKAQSPKRRKKKEKSKKEEDPNLGHKWDLYHLGSRSFERKLRRS